MHQGVSPSVIAYVLGGMQVRLAAKMCMFYSLEHGEIGGFCHSVFCIVHEWSLPKRAWFPINAVNSRALLQLRALCKELGKHSLHGPAPFLVTEALGSSEAEVWFSQVNKEETPVGTCQQPSSSCWNGGLKICKIFSLSVPPLQLAGKEKLWCSRKVILETWFLGRENLLPLRAFSN